MQCGERPAASAFMRGYLAAPCTRGRGVRKPSFTRRLYFHPEERGAGPVRSMPPSTERSDRDRIRAWTRVYATRYLSGRCAAPAPPESWFTVHSHRRDLDAPESAPSNRCRFVRSDAHPGVAERDGFVALTQTARPNR